MSIITKPASIQKNVPAEFTLNKSELAQLLLISSDLSNKEWKIKRVGSTTTFYTNGELNLTTTELTGSIRPHATLNPGNGGDSLISSSIKQL